MVTINHSEEQHQMKPGNSFRQIGKLSSYLFTEMHECQEKQVVSSSHQSPMATTSPTKFSHIPVCPKEEVMEQETSAENGMEAERSLDVETSHQMVPDTLATTPTEKTTHQ